MSKMTSQDFELLNGLLSFPPAEKMTNVEHVAECLDRCNELRSKFVINALGAETDYHHVMHGVIESFGPLSSYVQAHTRSKDFFNLCVKHMFDSLEVDHAILIDFLTEYFAPDEPDM